MTESVLSIKEVRERQESLAYFFSFHPESTELEALHNKLKAYLEHVEAIINNDQDGEE